MSAHTDIEAFTNFLNILFADTEGPINLAMLRNAAGAGPQITSSDIEKLKKFVIKHDKRGWGAYTCVSTMLSESHHHAKESINEIPSLHIDIDFKDITDSKEDVVRKLKALRLPPSWLVDSGNGIHAYWKFKEAFCFDHENADDINATVERIEDTLRLLCDLVGGDVRVTHTAALMRLPGTFNTKREHQNHLVTLCVNDANGAAEMPVYELDDIEEWLSETSPVILRKDRPEGKTVKEDDSTAARFERLAEEFGYKPPIKVDERLDNMMYMGSGDSAIHATQVSVSASMLENGVDIDEVVQIILEATKIAAGDYGKRWNWKREEKNIRKACEGWIKKQEKRSERKKEKVHTNGSGNGQTGPQSTSGPASPGKKAKNKQLPFHIVVAEDFLSDLQGMGHDLRIFVDDKNYENFWRYEDGLWVLVNNIDVWLEGEVERIIRGLRNPNESTIKMRAEARKFIMCSPNVRKLQPETFDQHGMIPVMGQLIDPLTLKARPIKKEDYCTWTLNVVYDPDAKCPWWLQMMEDVFEDKSEEDKKENIELLQDFGGASLVNNKGKGLRRALVPFGDSNSGKTSLVDVMSGMITDRPITTPIADLNNSHGLQAFVQRRPWVLQEAFNQSVWHISDKAKAILSGDIFEINPKGKNAIGMRFTSPAYWPTNHAPKFKEATKAIINRIVVIHMTNEFKVGEERGAMVEARKHGHSEPQQFVLANEKSGILNWMLVGAQRVLPRGFYKDTKEGLKILRDIRLDSNYAVGFVEDCCDFDDTAMISTPDFHLAFTNWYKENHGEGHVPSPVALGVFLSAMSHPLIAIDRDRFKDNSGLRFIVGIKLNVAGKSHWEEERDGMVQSSVSPSRVSTTLAGVTKSLVKSWNDHPAILRMKLNAAKKRTAPRF